MTVPCLVHPHHTVDTLDRTTGPDNPSKNLRDTLIGRLPLRAQTLTHDLLYHYQLRQAGVWWLCLCTVASRKVHKRTQASRNRGSVTAWASGSCIQSR